MPQDRGKNRGATRPHRPEPWTDVRRRETRSLNTRAPRAGPCRTRPPSEPITTPPSCEPAAAAYRARAGLDTPTSPRPLLHEPAVTAALADLTDWLAGAATDDSVTLTIDGLADQVA